MLLFILSLIAFICGCVLLWWANRQLYYHRLEFISICIMATGLVMTMVFGISAICVASQETVEAKSGIAYYNELRSEISNAVNYDSVAVQNLNQNIMDYNQKIRTAQEYLKNPWLNWYTQRFYKDLVPLELVKMND
jgi:hypothetical protein